MIEGGTPEESSTFTLASACCDSRSALATEDRPQPWNLQNLLLLTQDSSEESLMSKEIGTRGKLGCAKTEVQAESPLFYNSSSGTGRGNGNGNGPINRSGYYAPLPTTSPNEIPAPTYFPHAFSRSTAV